MFISREIILEPMSKSKMFGELHRLVTSAIETNEEFAKGIGIQLVKVGAL